MVGLGKRLHWGTAHCGGRGVRFSVRPLLERDL